MGYLEERMLRKNGVMPLLPTKKQPKPIPKKSAKKKAEEKRGRDERGDGDTDLQRWYAAIMAKEEGRCWETGEKINKEDSFGWHGSIAHVLPKSKFESVATHPQNYMILKMWGGTHAKYDASWESASKMKVWPYAIKIINILYPLLTSEEKARIRNIEVIAQEIRPEVYNSR